MAFDPEGTPEERAEKVRNEFHFMSLADLRGAEFLRLLRLAHDEGLLAELMRVAGCEDRQEGCLVHRHLEGSICHQSERIAQPIPSLSAGRRDWLSAFVWLRPKSWFRRAQSS